MAKNNNTTGRALRDLARIKDDTIWVLRSTNCPGVIRALRGERDEARRRLRHLDPAPCEVRS